MGTEYQQILDAIAAYYGKGDIWAEFAQYGIAAGSTNPEMAAALKQVPGIKTVVNSEGKIMSWAYEAESYGANSAATNLAQAANSNIASSTTGSMGAAAQAAESAGGGVATKTATKVKTPINTSTGAGGAITSMKTGVLQTGKFTIADVIYPLLAVGTGIKLGKWIDSTLYNANPDFWNKNGMSSLNPETWATITNGESGIANGLFNTIFEIDTDTGEVQPYIDQNAFAYFTAYMIQQGVFAAGESSITGSVPITGGSISPITPLYVSQEPFERIETMSNGNQYKHIWEIESGNPQFTYANYLNGVLLMASADTFTIRHTTYYRANASGTWSQSSSVLIGPSSQTYGGKSYYYLTSYGSASAVNIEVNYPESDATNFSQTDGTKKTSVLLSYGAITPGGGMDGITNQDGSTQFDASGISDPTDISEVLAALQTQFPDLFSDAITNNVLQDDGTVTDITYIPIGYPQSNPENAQQPTGNVATQDKPWFDPSDDPTEDVIQSIIELITYQYGYDGDTPIVEPDPVTDLNPPDTGEGTTPAAAVPSGSASALFAVYNPTQAQVDSFGAWLWSSNFVDQLKKIFNDPMESIISLHKIFVSPSVGSAQDIYVGYLDSGVSSATVTNQYADADCGSVSLLEYFGNVLDYTETSIDLYLPFVGIVPLSPDDVMRSSINVKYHCDVLTGACLVDVIITRDLAGGILYQYSGDCAVHYPVSAGSYMGIVAGLLSVAGGIAGTVATGGAALPVLMGAGGAVMSSHTRVERSGGFSANAGSMGAKKPYLIISRPQTAMPETYLTMEGIGSNQSVTLSACTGLVKVKEVQLTGIDALDEELDEIMDLLRGGVIL